MKKTAREELKNKKRIVIKIGSSSLTHPETGDVNLVKIERLIRVISDLRGMGKEVVLVSSGAIAAGRQALGCQKPQTVAEKQAYAAVGKARLMMVYQKICADEGRNNGRKPVIIAEFDLISGDRVVFIDHRHSSQL